MPASPTCQQESPSLGSARGHQHQGELPIGVMMLQGPSQGPLSLYIEDLAEAVGHLHCS